MHETNKIVGDALIPSYTKQQVLEATLKYFKEDSLATNVWIDKYCLKDLQGNYLELTPNDMHKRLAREFARIELKYPNPLSYEDIYNLLKNFNFILPGGSILYGCENSYSISSLGNCFVIGNNSDSYGGICTTDQELCQLFKRRSGVGHDISHLRPDKTPTSNAAGYGTGPVSFMSRFSHTARETAQSGRRGAQMITIDINHPDIQQFIICKDDLSQITGANISVKITDEFMKAVENDKEFDLEFTKDLGYGAIYSKPNPIFGQTIEWWTEEKTDHLVKSNYKIRYSKITVKAKPLWDKLIHQAWKSAEPKLWDLVA